MLHKKCQKLTVCARERHLKYLLAKLSYLRMNGEWTLPKQENSELGEVLGPRIRWNI